MTERTDFNSLCECIVCAKLLHAAVGRFLLAKTIFTTWGTLVIPRWRCVCLSYISTASSTCTKHRLTYLFIYSFIHFAKWQPRAYTETDTFKHIGRPTPGLPWTTSLPTSVDSSSRFPSGARTDTHTKSQTQLNVLPICHGYRPCG